MMNSKDELTYKIENILSYVDNYTNEIEETKCDLEEENKELNITNEKL
jgi:peptidoglycan hydrolase CwlO-like protein